MIGSASDMNVMSIYWDQYVLLRETIYFLVDENVDS